MSRPAPAARPAWTLSVSLLVLLFAVGAHAQVPARSAPATGRAWAHPWGRDAIIYGVVPSLFGKQPFKDVIARLPQLKELGVDVIWLSPINETIPGDFGYSVTSYFDLRSDYGTKEDFLGRACSLRGGERTCAAPRGRPSRPA